MSKGPGLFSDIGKLARDLLTRDYSSDQKFTVSTFSSDVDCGVGLTSTTVTKGGFAAGDVVVQYKYKSSIVDVKVDTESNISTTLTFAEVLPSTKTIATFKLPDYNSGKLEVQYFHDHATLTVAAAVNQSPVLDLSGTVGTHGLAFGADAGFDTTAGCFTKYNAGISITKPDSSASVILANKGDVLKGSYLYNLDIMKRSAAVADITRRFSTNENTITVGCSHAVDPLTLVKARLNNHGQLGALIQHELKPKSVLTVSGEFDTKALDKNPKIGLSLALKP